MRFTLIQLACLSMVCAACGPPPSSGSRRSSGDSDAGSQQIADAGSANNPTDAGTPPARDTGAPPPPPVDAGPPPVQNSCSENGTGNTTGAKLANFRLQNCNGDWVELHDRCGRNKVQVVMLVTEWCPACAQGMQQFKGYSEQVGSDWNNIFVLGELGRSVPATLEACANVARAKGVDPANMVVDPAFARTLSQGWVRPCTNNGSFNLPQINILDGRDMTLRWESMCDADVDINDIVNGLLQAP